jgi:hypothetical protein
LKWPGINDEYATRRGKHHEAYNTTNMKLEAVLQCDRSKVAGSKIFIGNKDTETNYHQEKRDATNAIQEKDRVPR